MVLVYSELYNIWAVALRYFNIFGVNQRFDYYGNVIPIFVDNIINNKQISIYGDCEQTRDFLNVIDVVRANYLVDTNNKIKGAYNVGSDNSISINHLVKLLKMIFDNEISFVYQKPRIVDVLHCKANITIAFLDFRFTSEIDLYQSLKEYVQWYIFDKQNL